jgi:hypothetical protein
MQKESLRRKNEDMRFILSGVPKRLRTIRQKAAGMLRVRGYLSINLTSVAPRPPL